MPNKLPAFAPSPYKFYFADEICHVMQLLAVEWHEK